MFDSALANTCNCFCVPTAIEHTLQHIQQQHTPADRAAASGEVSLPARHLFWQQPATKHAAPRRQDGSSVWQQQHPGGTAPQVRGRTAMSRGLYDRVSWAVSARPRCPYSPNASSLGGGALVECSKRTLSTFVQFHSAGYTSRSCSRGRRCVALVVSACPC